MKKRGPRLTPSIAALIKGYWEHTDLNQAQIGAELGGINQGRVSEVVRGHRYSGVAPASKDLLHGA